MTTYLRAIRHVDPMARDAAETGVVYSSHPSAHKEGDPMPESQALRDLKKCMREANGDPGRIADCQREFEQGGGTVGGGKVFTAPDGGAVYIADGGKVFRLDPA